MFQRTCIIKAGGILWQIVLTNHTARFVEYFIINQSMVLFSHCSFTLEYPPLENR